MEFKQLDRNFYQVKITRGNTYECYYVSYETVVARFKESKGKEGVLTLRENWDKTSRTTLRDMFRYIPSLECRKTTELLIKNRQVKIGRVS